MRTLPKLGLLLATMGALLGLAQPASARPAPPKADDPGRVSVVKVAGLIDPVLADFVDRSITQANDSGAIAVVLQLDSGGSVVSDARLVALARHIHTSRVPVAVWVGPSGSQALGGAAQLAGSAQLLGMAPGSRLGKTGDTKLVEPYLSPAFQRAGRRLEDGTINDKQAKRLGITKRAAPVIGQFIIDLPRWRRRW